MRDITVTSPPDLLFPDHGLQPVEDPGGDVADEDPVRHAHLPGAGGVYGRGDGGLRPGGGLLEPGGPPVRLVSPTAGAPLGQHGRNSQTGFRPIY